jgi:hypothetical protein
MSYGQRPQLTLEDVINLPESGAKMPKLGLVRSCS